MVQRLERRYRQRLDDPPARGPSTSGSPPQMVPSYISSLPRARSPPTPSAPALRALMAAAVLHPQPFGADAKRRYAHINDGHVPDIIRYGTPPSCMEFKCYTPFHLGGRVGQGTASGGGAPSEVDGHFIAFGNTEEALRDLVLGRPARGDPADGPLDRTTGTGWVRAVDGQYADAIAKGHAVTLLGMESTGALYHVFSLHLRLLGRLSTAPGTHDSTQYGTNRASTKCFYRHHCAAIANAVTLADANTLLNTAAYMSFDLTRALPACLPPSP
mmetsp:Transcript_30806/g.98551  ORF Transcript_30806/g.98551 Transcript_30806/m.98551 type:complete len:272 (-) Transcript_30806:171-986(-)